MNPLGGCLPILIQMPFLIAMYWVLVGAVELRNAPWIGWITDLTIPTRTIKATGHHGRVDAVQTKTQSSPTRSGGAG